MAPSIVRILQEAAALRWAVLAMAALAAYWAPKVRWSSLWCVAWSVYRENNGQNNGLTQMEIFKIWHDWNKKTSCI